MKKSHIIIFIFILSLLLLPLFILSKELTLFQNNTASVSMSFMNPGNDTENSTFVWFPPYECAYDSRMTITGEYLPSANDSPYEVVLATDLSNSMDYCITEPFINDSIPWEDSYMFADLVGEGSFWNKWEFPVGNWERLENTVIDSFVLRQNTVWNDDDKHPIALLKGMRFGNLSAKFTARLTGGSSDERYLQLNLGRDIQSRLNFYPHTGPYTLRFMTDNNIWLYKDTVRVATGASPYSLSKFQPYIVTADAGRITVAVNGSTVINYAGSEPFEAGYLSFSTRRINVDLDDIYITSLDHTYTATKPYGYSSRVPGNAYLYKDIDWSPLIEGICLNYTVGSPPAVTSCDGLPFCTTQCSGYSAPSPINCGSNPLCYSYASYSGSWVYCSASHPSYNAVCCNLPPAQSGNTNIPNNCCDATDPTATSCATSNLYDGIPHDTCNPGEWGGGNQIYVCRTVRDDDSYCTSGYTSWTKGTCTSSAVAANCVNNWCYSAADASVSTTPGMCVDYNTVSRNYWANCPAGGMIIPTSDTDIGWNTRCNFGGACGDPDIMCRQNLQKTATTCAGPWDTGASFCIALASDGGTYYEWTRTFEALERQYRDCLNPQYDWQVRAYRPYTTMYRYCPPANLYYRYCAVAEGAYNTRNDFYSVGFDDSLWGRLYDYAQDFDQYYQVFDGVYGSLVTNDWECADCGRFYRKEFNLTKNIAFGKIATQISGGGCSNFARLTDGNTRTSGASNYIDCGSGADILELDLGGLYNVTGLNAVMYYAEAAHRSYYLTLMLSDDSTFDSSDLIVWNSTISGPVLSTPEGPMFNIPQGYMARYARIRSHGYDTSSGFNNGNHFGELEVYTPLAKEDVDNLELSLNHDDGIICYLNGEFISHALTYARVDWGWGTNVPVDPDLLHNGSNLFACQVKNTGGYHGFNAQLIADINTTLIHRASDYRFIQQEKLCASENTDPAAKGDNPYNLDSTPAGDTCEYTEEVESCEGTYPYSFTHTLNLTVTGWTTSETSLSYIYYEGLNPVIEYIAMMLGGNVGVTGRSATSAGINNAIWSGDIIVLDSHWLTSGDPVHATRIGQAMIEGKTVIVDSDLADYISSRPGFSFGPMRTAISYDYYSRIWDVTFTNASHTGTGIIISDQVDWLAYTWYWGNYVGDRMDKAAHLVDAMYPVWKNTSVTYPVPSGSYCLQTKKTSGCEVCIGEKDKLAVINGLMFLNLTVGLNISGVKVGLVTFGSSADTCLTNYPLSENETLLMGAVRRYDPGCGETCISCSIKKSLETLGPYIGNNVSDNIVLMTDGLANTIISGASSETLARKETLHWACNTTFSMSAARRNVTIHTIYYGNNKTDKGRLAMELMMNISNCTGGIFTSGDDPSELEDAYRVIIGVLGTGFPKPRIRFGMNDSVPYDYKYTGPDSLRGPVVWHNRSCGVDGTCINLMTAFNREIMECVERNVTDYIKRGCDVRINVSTNRSGTVRLSNLNLSVVNSSRAPVAYPYELPLDFNINMCPIDGAECGNGIHDETLGEQCENISDCGVNEFCIPPQHEGECTCTDTSSVNCGDQNPLDPGEQCDSFAAFNDFSCYPPGSVIHPIGYGAAGYDLSCKWRSGDPCGDGDIDPGEECDPKAPSPYNDDACLGDYRCIPPGTDRSCTCVKPSWNVHATGGGSLYLEATAQSILPDINLLNHAVSPLYPRSQLLWSVGPPSNSSLAAFSVSGTYLRANINQSKGLVNVTVWVHDPMGLSDNFTLILNISSYVPTSAMIINSSIIATSNKIIDSYFEDTVSGRLTEIGPYLFTMKVYRDER